jgi:hypothetical protein
MKHAQQCLVVLDQMVRLDTDTTAIGQIVTKKQRGGLTLTYYQIISLIKLQPVGIEAGLGGLPFLRNPCP